ncbi:MAG: vitamin K epoxide reductase family protein [Fidelibacterota bacterium]
MSVVFILLALLALAGGAFSFYFLQVTRLKMSPNVWWMPPVCRVGTRTCQTIVDTPYGRTFGRPNAFWGCLFYPVLFVVVLATGWMDLNPTVILAFSIGMVSVSLYLLWGLFRLNTLCRVCMAVHTVNFLFFGLVVIELSG